MRQPYINGLVDQRERVHDSLAFGHLDKLVSQLFNLLSQFALGFSHFLDLALKMFGNFVLLLYEFCDFFRLDGLIFLEFGVLMLILLILILELFDSIFHVFYVQFQLLFDTDVLADVSFQALNQLLVNLGRTQILSLLTSGMLTVKIVSTFYSTVTS